MQPFLEVLLVGNYSLDGQQSMLRFASMMEQGLRDEACHAEIVYPTIRVGRLGAPSPGIRKWMRYIDKYILFPPRLRARIKRSRNRAESLGRQLVVHICDHSNSMYVPIACLLGVPVVITCHDLGAVRGALGEETSCSASRPGKLLQQWILKGLGRAELIACVSSATRRDVERLVRTPGGSVPATRTVLLGQNTAYSTLDAAVVGERLTAEPGIYWETTPFVLNVGSSLNRKNREGVLRIFALLKDRWPGILVFAGERLSSSAEQLVDELGLRSRVAQIENPSDELLEVLYNRAFALLFPSKFEGFGWPVIEAQACGCPVLCSDAGSLAEVAGESGFVQPWEQEDQFANEIMRMAEDESRRQHWIRLGYENIQRFQTKRMIGEYISIYEELAKSVQQHGSAVHMAVDPQ